MQLTNADIAKEYNQYLDDMEMTPEEFNLAQFIREMYFVCEQSGAVFDDKNDLDPYLRDYCGVHVGKDYINAYRGVVFAKQDAW